MYPECRDELSELKVNHIMIIFSHIPLHFSQVFRYRSIISLLLTK